MTEADRAYMKEHKLHVLMDDMARDLIKEKPANPAAFMRAWLDKNPAGATDDGPLPGTTTPQPAEEEDQPALSPSTSISKKHAPPQIQFDQIFETSSRVAHFEIETAAALIKDKSSKTIVFDCRAVQRGGIIPDSVQVPLQIHEAADPTAELAATYGGKYSNYLFVATVSDDVDLVCAQGFAKHTGGNIGVIVGGMLAWLKKYYDDPLLVEDHNAMAYDLAHTRDANRSLQVKSELVQSLSLEIDEGSVTTMSMEAAADLVKGNHALVFDCRAEQRGGTIPGSVQLAPEDQAAIAEAAKKYQTEGRHILFISTVHPDVDVVVGNQFVEEVRKLNPTAAAGLATYTIDGGAVRWFRTHKDDEALVKDYDPKAFDDHRGLPFMVNNTKKEKLTLELEEALVNKISGDAAAALLKDANSKTVVFDCRSELRGGKIPNAVHVQIENENAVTELFAAYKDKDVEHFLFISLMPYDIDHLIATTFSELLREHTGSTTVRTFCVAGGGIGWFRAFHDDPALVIEYDAKAFDSLEHPLPLKKKKKGPQLQIEEQSIIARVPPEVVADTIRAKNSRTIVFDCRLDQRGGMIPGSVHVPPLLGTNVADEIFAKYGTNDQYDQFLFVSMVSPDLDEIVAAAFLTKLGEAGSAKTCGLVGGGMLQWLKQFSSVPELVEKYDAEVLKGLV